MARMVIRLPAHQRRRLLGHELRPPSRGATERGEVDILDADLIAQPAQRRLVESVTASNRIVADIDQLPYSVAEQEVQQRIDHDAFITYRIDGRVHDGRSEE